MVQTDFNYDKEKKSIVFFKNGKPTGGIIGRLATGKIPKTYQKQGN